jgi:DNA-binding beta-propeller fold protein YncE
MPKRSRQDSFPRLVLLTLLLTLCAVWLIGSSVIRKASAQNPFDFKNFEAPQVHPLAITPDGTRLLATNTPNGTLSVFHITGTGLTLMAEIPVGLEPVSVAARNNSEAWVTNWLSDSVSVVDLNRFRTMRSFDVGDEPTDVVFAGQQKELAFVCVSGRSEIKIFDPLSPATAPQVIAIRAKQPRALTRNASGSRVFVSVFESGNQTTIVPAAGVFGAGGPPPPSPPMSPGLPAAPAVGLIVKWNGTGWADETGNTIWSGFIPYTLADIDVVVIDSQGQSPFVSILVRGVGTHIGNATFDNTNNRLYVANDEARNHIRFEPNLRGRFLNSRVSAITVSGTPTTTAGDLNSHINYSNPTGSDAERALSLALPADIALAPDGTLYVAATGSAKVGVLDPQGVVQARIAVGQGPTGLALNGPRNLLYVLNRFDETVSIVDLITRSQTSTLSIGFNPEPTIVSNGRRFLYDASLSAHGDLACASCHFSGHRDGLAWDLGDPQGQMQVVNGGVSPSIFHPMKGPMTTQSLRGIIGTEPLHWRGDRAALGNFNAAFPNLLGGTRQLTGPELGDFTAFIRSLTYPPNPHENLDRTLPNPVTGPNASRGAQLFNTGLFDAGALTCNQCHTALPGFFSGTNRLIIPAVALQESQDFKVPQLRGLYQKLGMLNAPGEQITGFGFLHDGSIDSLLSFLRVPVFTFQNDNQRRDVEQFVLAFDTGTAPAVGLQVTVNDSNKSSPSVTDRINLLMAQANAGNCELVVKGVFNRTSRAFLFNGNNQFLPDRLNEPNLTSQTLIQAAGTGELTFTGVPLGAGRRSSIDREVNGILDGDQPPQPNALDSAQFFVWQHYVDFLNRDPDPGGLGFWSNSIQQCGSDPLCIHLRRIGVSAAFFIELEFQRTGSFVYRAFKGGLGRRPAFSEFSTDRRQIIEGPNLEQTKQAYALAFVQRGEFITRYAGKTSAQDFVDALIAVIQQSSGVDLSGQRSALISKYITGTDMNQSRALALRDAIDNAGFVNAEFNPSFVLMQYFGYLQREPDDEGYNFWLDVLNNREPNNFRAMVCAFITSTEYQQRFGWSVTRRNSDCSQL